MCTMTPAHPSPVAVGKFLCTPEPTSYLIWSFRRSTSIPVPVASRWIASRFTTTAALCRSGESRCAELSTWRRTMISVPVAGQWIASRFTTTAAPCRYSELHLIFSRSREIVAGAAFARPYVSEGRPAGSCSP